VTQIEVLAAIKEAIVQSGTSAIFISHDLAVIAQIAHRTMVLQHGVCVEENATRTSSRRLDMPTRNPLWAVRSHTWREHPAAADAQPLLTVHDLAAAYGIHRCCPEFRSICTRVAPWPRWRVGVRQVHTGPRPQWLALLRMQGESHSRGRSLAARLTDRSMADRRCIQLIHQSADSALNPRQTIGEILGRPVELYFGEGRTRKDNE
jgi:peptide/nickel transport system ATP-binding protein